MPYRGTCFERVALLQISFFETISPPKKVAVQKSNYPKVVTPRQKICSEKVAILKKNCCKEVTVLKKELVKKADALKKQLLGKSNCCVEVRTLKKCEEKASLKIKLSQHCCKLEKSQHMREGKLLFKKILKLNW